MTHRLATNYAKNYCNRTLIVKSYCRKCGHMFFLGHGVFTALLMGDSVGWGNQAVKEFGQYV